MVLCLVNAIIMILKCIIHTICYIAYVVLLFTKLIKFERCGEAASLLHFVLKAPEPKYEETNKEEPKELSKSHLRKSDKNIEEDVERLRSIKEESKKSH